MANPVFFCEACRAKNDWEGSKRKSLGKCEVCGRISNCHDVARKYLTPPKETR